MGAEWGPVAEEGRGRPLPAPEGLLLVVCEGAHWPAAPKGPLGTEPTASVAEWFPSHLTRVGKVPGGIGWPGRGGLLCCREDASRRSLGGPEGAAQPARSGRVASE